MIFVLLILAAFAPLTTLAQTKFVKSVPTLTELRALNVADIHTNVLVNSYWSGNTNSIGAIFQWVPNATDATNTYSVFAPASGSGRWIRVELPANPGSASQPGQRFLDNQRSGWFSGLGTNIIAASTDGTERWRIGSTGILQANGAQTIQTSSGTLTVQPAGTTVLGSTSGSTGIGTTGPDAKLDVLDASGNEQIRTTYTDGTVYTKYRTLSDGSTLISDSSGRMINSTIVNNTAVSARARQGGLAFDGVTATAKDLHTIGANIGTSDLTYYAEFQVPSSNPSSTIGLLQLGSVSSTHVSTSALSVFISSAGTLFFTLYGPSSTSDFIQDSIASFVSSYAGKVVSLAVVKNSTTPSLTVYVNGVIVATSSSSAGGITWGATVASTYCNVGSNGGSSYSGNILTSRLFTRALSASEVVDLANKGVPEGDKWASLTAAYDSQRAGGFDTGVDSFAALNGTVTGNVDGIGTPPQNDNLSFYADATSGSHAARRSTTVMQAGKRYRVKYSYFIPSTNTNVGGVTSATSGGSNIGDSARAVLDAWTDVSFDTTTIASTTGIGFYAYNKSFSLSFSGANSPTNDLFYVRGITITEIGCLLDADLAVGVGYQAPDRSSNHYDGLISTSGVSHVVEQRRGQARFSLSADGYLGDTTSRACIPDNARIESITAYSTGTPTFTVGDDSGAAANVVGSVTLTASTLTDLTLLKRFLTTGVDGRCYVDFTAGAAATTFTITYSTTGNY